LFVHEGPLRRALVVPIDTRLNDVESIKITRAHAVH